MYSDFIYGIFTDECHSIKIMKIKKLQSGNSARIAVRDDGCASLTHNNVLFEVPKKTSKC